MTQSKKILVAVTNDISTDQRVHKICNYLVEKGNEVTVYGRVLPDTFEVKRCYKIIRKKHFFNHNFLFYAEYNLRLFWFLLVHKFHIIYANDLDTLMASFLGAKLLKAKLIYDSHEYFTETPELQGRKFVQRFWLQIERFFLPKVEHAITVSKTIADEYKQKYGVEMQVIRNLPSLKREIIEEKVSFPTKNKVVLYQGVLNPGRGIKSMIDSLKYIENVDLVIIGFGKVKEELMEFSKTQGLESRVHFLGRIAHEKLPNYGKIANIGMVLEEPLGKSFQYSLPNKLFDFIHVGLPIIASPLVEVKNVVEKYNVGIVVDNHNPKHIAEKINLLLNNVALYNKIKLNQKNVKNDLSWEHEIKLLDHLF